MLALGTISMVAGLILLVTSVRLTIPNLALFLIGGALIGAGAGAVFKGTTGIVLGKFSSESESRSGDITMTPSTRPRMARIAVSIPCLSA